MVGAANSQPPTKAHAKPGGKSPYPAIFEQCSIKSEEAIHVARTKLVRLISLLYLCLSESAMYKKRFMVHTAMEIEIHAKIAATDVPLEGLSDVD